MKGEKGWGSGWKRKKGSERSRGQMNEERGQMRDNVLHQINAACWTLQRQLSTKRRFVESIRWVDSPPPVRQWSPRAVTAGLPPDSDKPPSALNLYMWSNVWWLRCKHKEKPAFAVCLSVRGKCKRSHCIKCDGNTNYQLHNSTIWIVNLPLVPEMSLKATVFYFVVIFFYLVSAFDSVRLLSFCRV